VTASESGIDRILRKRYILALSIIACLVIVSQLAIQYSIGRNEDDSRVINIAGRQRMLSQRITKCVLGLYITDDPAKKADLLAKLIKAIELWEVSHRGLQRGDAEMGLPGDNSPEIKALFSRIQKKHLIILDAAKSIAALEADKTSDKNMIRREIQRITDNEGEFLKGMDTIVFQYDSEAKTKVRMVKHIEMGLAIITLLVLCLEALFIFRPAELQIKAKISKQKELEQQLRQSQKMEAMGQLAGGIAHDFNNLLTAVIGNISLMKMMSDQKDKKMTERLDAAESAANRAKDLTQRLLTFSTGGAPVRKPISLAALVREYAGLALSGSSALCEYVIPDDLWPVYADEGQIGQVVGNLVINAHQAMPEGGRIRISCENASDILPIRSVRMLISDEGIGIPPENMERIFDPFFTTKEKGRGLGLATTYSIIRNHEGLIRVESETGHGATFIVSLPASGSAVAPSGARKESPLFGTEKVLVMDDEEIIRETARVMLEAIGYTVEDARDGAEAITLYESALQSGTPFAAVIMDLIIPGGMGGKEAVGRLLEIDPQARVIVSSGYSNDQVMANYRDYGFVEVVSKPYNVGELSRKLAGVITMSA